VLFRSEDTTATPPTSEPEPAATPTTTHDTSATGTAAPSTLMNPPATAPGPQEGESVDKKDYLEGQ